MRTWPVAFYLKEGDCSKTFKRKSNGSEIVHYQAVYIETVSVEILLMI